MRCRRLLSALLAGILTVSLAACSPANHVASRIENGVIVLVLPACLDVLEDIQVRLVTDDDGHEVTVWAHPGTVELDGVRGRFREVPLDGTRFPEARGDYSAGLAGSLEEDAQLSLLVVFRSPLSHAASIRAELGSPAAMAADGTDDVWVGESGPMRPREADMVRSDLCTHA